MKYLNIEPHECIIFEDSLNGCRAGIRSNALTVGITTTQTAQALYDEGCKYAIKDYTKIRLDESLLNIENFTQP